MLITKTLPLRRTIWQSFERRFTLDETFIATPLPLERPHIRVTVPETHLTHPMSITDDGLMETQRGEDDRHTKQISPAQMMPQHPQELDFLQFSSLKLVQYPKISQLAIPRTTRNGLFLIRTIPKEPFVVPHEQVRLNPLEEIQRNRYHNQQPCTPKEL